MKHVLNGRLGGFFIGTILIAVLALSIVPSAFAAMWLYYDDGSAEVSYSTGTYHHLVVRFSLPDGWSQARLKAVKYYIHSTATLTSFKVHIVGSDHCTELLTPAITVTPTTKGTFFTVDLTPYNIIVSGDFYVSIEYLTSGQPEIGLDTTPPDALRSGDITGFCGGMTGIVIGNLMIRAEIDLPVGGVAYSPDKLGLLSPLLIVTGLIGAIVIGSFVVKKRGI